MAREVRAPEGASAAGAADVLALSLGRGSTKRRLVAMRTTLLPGKMAVLKCHWTGQSAAKRYKYSIAGVAQLVERQLPKPEDGR